MTASAVLNYQQESKGVVVTARVAAVMAAMMGTAGMFVMGTVVCRVVLLGGYRVSAPGFEIVAIVACVVVMLLLYVLLMEMVRGVLLRQKWAVVTAFIFACALSLLAGFSAFMFARHWEHVGWPGMWSIVMLGVTVGSAVSAGLALRRPKPGVAAADATRIYLFLHGLLAAGAFLAGLALLTDSTGLAVRWRNFSEVLPTPPGVLVSMGNMLVELQQTKWLLLLLLFAMPLFAAALASPLLVVPERWRGKGYGRKWKFMAWAMIGLLLGFGVLALPAVWVILHR